MKLFWVDAFASQPFTGNPAGVVPLAAWPADALMQQIAFENGLAETAFFVRTGDARFHLRWFTPAVEVDLCGHATLASAFIVFSELGQAGDRITFDSRSGPLIVTRRPDGSLELDFPATPPRAESDAGVRARVAAAIGTDVHWLGRSPFDLFAVVAAPGAVAAIKPDLIKIAALGGRGLIVTAAGGPAGVDFVSRFFAPQAGVPEDPVTGSAHCALVPYWAGQLGRATLAARQISPRGGDLACVLAGDRVRLAGRAVLYLRGELAVEMRRSGASSFPAQP
jgi:PhzF family phenazine biosynthesis protein